MKTTTTAEISETEQTYVETIHSLIQKHGYARAVDIAAALNVKPPSVTSMLQKLDEEKLVIYTRYRGVVLTSEGRLLAETLERRHQALRRFLIMIGIREEDAEKDACEIEHRISPETVERLAGFVEFMQSDAQAVATLKDFK
jgi:DtxR family Mn-dependent transcriptional regulator